MTDEVIFSRNCRLADGTAQSACYFYRASCGVRLGLTLYAVLRTIQTLLATPEPPGPAHATPATNRYNRYPATEDDETNKVLLLLGSSLGV
jgi:hypothetical protein